MHMTARAHTQCRWEKGLEGCTIAHLSSKLKMVIDPWNINGQSCFSLSCEGERRKPFEEKKREKKEQKKGPSVQRRSFIVNNPERNVNTRLQ